MHRAKILLHPVFIIALIVLLLNDHLLKAAWPGPVTGKLSDFAGLIVLAFLLTAVGAPAGRRLRFLAGLHAAVGLAWIAWKLAPVEILLTSIANATGLPVPARVKDPTDLIALAVLPACFALLRRLSNATTTAPTSPILRKLAAAGLMTISVFAIVATSPPYRGMEWKPDPRIETNLSLAEAADTVENILSDRNLLKIERDAYDCNDCVNIRFQYVDSTDTISNDPWDWAVYTGYVRLQENSDKGTVLVDHISFGRTEYKYSDSLMRREVLAPIVVDLRRRLAGE